MASKTITVKIRSEIGRHTLGRIEEQLENYKDGDKVKVLINSFGGSVNDAWAIYAYLRKFKPEVHVEAFAASAATVIMFAAEEVRTIYDTAEILIHNPWIFAIGDAKDLENEVERLKETEERITDFYAARLNIERDEIKELMNEEKWIGGTEAGELGFFTEVIKPEEDERELLVQNLADAKLEFVTSKRAKAAADKYNMQHNNNNNNIDDRGDTMPDNVDDQGTADQGTQDQNDQGGGDQGANNTGDTSTNTGASASQIEAARAKERTRMAEIFKLEATYKDLDLSEDVAKWIEDGTSVTDAKLAILDKLAKQDNEAESVTSRARRDEFEGDADTMKDTFANVLLNRANLLEDKEFEALSDDVKRNVEIYQHYDLSRIAEVFAGAKGHVARGQSKQQTIMNAYTMTTDYPALTLDVANKAMLKGYEEAREVFELLTTTVSNSDFKARNLVGLNTIKSLQKVREGKEIENVYTSDRQAQTQLGTVAGIFAITREALINDDLDQMTKIPMRLGRAAKRSIGDDFAALFTGNQVVSLDGKGLFHGDHGNVINDGLSTAALGKIRTLMVLQEDDEGTNAGFTPRYLYVPESMVVAAWTLLNSSTDMGRGTAQQGANPAIPNWAQGKFEVVSDYRLDANSTSRYYALSAPSDAENVVVSYLNGTSEPWIDTQQGFRILGQEWRVVLDYDLAIVDFRGIARGGA